MYRATSSVKSRRPLLALAASVLVLILACGRGGGEQTADRVDPLQSPAFLTPVAEAQASGVKPYWMGKEFNSNDTIFKVSPVAYFIDEMGYGFGLDYSTDVGEGAVLTRVQVFAEAKGAYDAMIRSAGTVGVTGGEHVQIGQWRGEVVVLPGGPSRPTNQLWLFVELGKTGVIVQAFSGSTGVPSTDGNPLIDKDQLIQVVAENLRPYPQ